MSGRRSRAPSGRPVHATRSCTPTWCVTSPYSPNASDCKPTSLSGGPAKRSTRRNLWTPPTTFSVPVRSSSLPWPITGWPGQSHSPHLTPPRPSVVTTPFPPAPTRVRWLPFPRPATSLSSSPPTTPSTKSSWSCADGPPPHPSPPFPPTFLCPVAPAAPAAPTSSSFRRTGGLPPPSLPPHLSSRSSRSSVTCGLAPRRQRPRPKPGASLRTP